MNRELVLNSNHCARMIGAMLKCRFFCIARSTISWFCCFGVLFAHVQHYFRAWSSCFILELMALFYFHKGSMRVVVFNCASQTTGKRKCVTHKCSIQYFSLFRASNVHYYYHYYYLVANILYQNSKGRNNGSWFTLTDKKKTFAPGNCVGYGFHFRHVSS